jgi:ubiquitin-protein ligase E3 A
LITPTELEMLICGKIEEYDFSELQKICKYINYTPQHKIIQYFWEIVKSFSQTNKRKLLLFVTSSDRIPLEGFFFFFVIFFLLFFLLKKGFRALDFTIQRAGPDSDNLLVAHTCFSILDLPEYSSKEKLEQKLIMSIENCEGFGLR